MIEIRFHSFYLIMYICKGQRHVRFGIVQNTEQNGRDNILDSADFGFHFHRKEFAQFEGANSFL